jgi:hypothetical protein
VVLSDLPDLPWTYYSVSPLPRSGALLIKLFGLPSRPAKALYPTLFFRFEIPFQTWRTPWQTPVATL